MLKAAWIFAYGFASAVLIADTLSGERNHSASLQPATMASAGGQHGQR